MCWGLDPRVVICNNKPAIICFRRLDNFVIPHFASSETSMFGRTSIKGNHVRGGFISRFQPSITKIQRYEITDQRLYCLKCTKILADDDYFNR